MKNKQVKGITTVKVVASAFTLSCLFLLLCLSMLAPALAEEEHLPDLNITAIKPYHYEWCEECVPPCPKGDPWFNLENYVEVTVVNIGNAPAENFEVKLYADGEPIGRKTVDELPAYSEDNPEANTTDMKFKWTPELEKEEGDPLSCTDTADGAICRYDDTSREYTLKAEIGEDDEVLEQDQKVVWNGYRADEPLEIYAHGEVEGGILYTTGDSEYRSYESGDSGTDDTYYDINYELEISSGSTKLARLYIYYTWAKPSYKAPKIGVILTTPSGDTYNLNMEKSYNDIKGDLGGERYAWGTYAYDITECVKERGTYVVSVTNLNYGGGDSDFADKYSFASPAILVVYEDTAEPRREYWINEGADLLMGGVEERPYGGFLSLEECKNTATFDGEHRDLEVEEAVLGVVSAWGGNPESGWHSYLYFNGNELGMDVYDGYSGSCSKGIGGVSMYIGSDNAQVGIELTDITDGLEDYNNEVIQGDDGDNMMPANAFLVITYEEEEEEEEEEGRVTSGSPNITAWNPVESVVNNTEGESRTFNITVNQTVDVSWQINGTEVQTNESITEAAYPNTSAVVGTWNVSAIATNTATGLSDIHTWIWKVTPAALTATSTQEVNITQTPTPTAISTVNVTPTPTLAITPTSTPAEEKKKPGADEAPVPGFELAISLVMLITVAYLIRKRGI